MPKVRVSRAGANLYTAHAVGVILALDHDGGIRFAVVIIMEMGFDLGTVDLERYRWSPSS